MDRLLAPNSVPFAQADTAPTTGTPQYATDGNPASNIPATLWPAYAFNALQDEIYNVIVAGGLTPNRNSWNQLLAAIVALIGKPQNNLVSGVVGQVRNLVSSVATAGTTKTVTADEVIVETALGGLRYCMSSLSLTGNLSTQMDTGSAPVSGYVGEYLIYNPNAAISGTNPRLLYTNATSAVAPSVYGGANPVSGYTASALIGVWPTNASGQFVVGDQIDRTMYLAGLSNVVTGVSQVTTLTSTTIAGAVPKNAKSFCATVNISINAAATLNVQLAASASSIGAQQNSLTTPTSTSGFLVSFPPVPIITPQTMFYLVTTTAGTALSYQISIGSYTF